MYPLTQGFSNFWCYGARCHSHATAPINEVTNRSNGLAAKKKYHYIRKQKRNNSTDHTVHRLRKCAVEPVNRKRSAFHKPLSIQQLTPTRKATQSSRLSAIGARSFSPATPWWGWPLTTEPHNKFLNNHNKKTNNLLRPPVSLVEPWTSYGALWEPMSNLSYLVNFFWTCFNFIL